ncbi:uncharacterized protein LOC128960522 [Oppia nitens]|uniref:uncharacterized protein LOC128960522 n=1 Tax=Oppia nitens TaxID=1686743 RepID=UPI0023DCCF78|nr:uncharacterized protein LOC128960522 [Oppia nitens]
MEKLSKMSESAKELKTSVKTITRLKRQLSPAVNINVKPKSEDHERRRYDRVAKMLAQQNMKNTKDSTKQLKSSAKQMENKSIVTDETYRKLITDLMKKPHPDFNSQLTVTEILHLKSQLNNLKNLNDKSKRN